MRSDDGSRARRRVTSCQACTSSACCCMVRVMSNVRSASFASRPRSARRIPGPSPAKVTGLLRRAQVVAQFDHEPLKAAPLLREALEMARSIYPGDHQQVALCLAELGRNQFEIARLTDAEATMREAAAMAHRLYGARHDETLAARRSLAGCTSSRTEMGGGGGDPQGCPRALHGRFSATATPPR